MNELNYLLVGITRPIKNVNNELYNWLDSQSSAADSMSIV
jgi:hypothetical protein